MKMTIMSIIVRLIETTMKNLRESFKETRDNPDKDITKN